MTKTWPSKYCATCKTKHSGKAQVPRGSIGLRSALTLIVKPGNWKPFTGNASHQVLLKGRFCGPSGLGRHSNSLAELQAALKRNADLVTKAKDPRKESTSCLQSGSIPPVAQSVPRPLQKIDLPNGCSIGNRSCRQIPVSSPVRPKMRLLPACRFVYALSLWIR